jgi:hypothetical protein
MLRSCSASSVETIWLMEEACLVEMFGGAK